MGFEPVTFKLLVRCSNNIAMKPSTLGASQFMGFMCLWNECIDEYVYMKWSKYWTVDHCLPRKMASKSWKKKLRKPKHPRSIMTELLGAWVN